MYAQVNRYKGHKVLDFDANIDTIVSQLLNPEPSPAMYNPLTTITTTNSNVKHIHLKLMPGLEASRGLEPPVTSFPFTVTIEFLRS